MIVIVELREPAPVIFAVSGEQVCSSQTCELLAGCGMFVGLKLWLWN